MSIYLAQSMREYEMSKTLFCPLGAHSAMGKSGLQTDNQNIIQSSVKVLWDHRGMTDPSWGGR